MSKEAKMELMSRILGQHSRNTDAVSLFYTESVLYIGVFILMRLFGKSSNDTVQLRRANFENQVLIEAATDDSDLSHSLRTQLGLTNEQCRRLASLSTYASDEARKLDAIRKCFSVLQAHDWLYFPGTEVRNTRVRLVASSPSVPDEAIIRFWHNVDDATTDAEHHDSASVPALPVVDDAQSGHH